jgi:protein-disulfide isomerase
MQSGETFSRVKGDIDEAFERGIQRTPMIFVNGVELKGWTAPNALSRTIQAVLAANLEPDTFASDLMPSALDKYMSDWSESPVRAVPPEVTRRAIGPKGAPVTVVVFGDYMEGGTQEADGLMRLYAAGPDSKIRYSFAHFPVNKECNPVTQVTKFESCRAAIVAEAAEVLLGEEGFWKAHDWLMLNKGVVNDNTLAGVAGQLGVDLEALTGAMQTATAREAVRADVQIAGQLGIQGIPLIFINGRPVPRFKLDNENLLPRMIDAAADGASVK